MYVNEQVPKLQVIIDKLAADGEQVRVLEAGCGSSSKVKMPNNAWLVGIDISQPQLDRNTILSEKILGDIQTFELPESGFDLIVCWDVLEHLEKPEAAIENFAHAIAPGGIIILAMPNLRSIKALITKITPHWFHVWAYRHVFGHKSAGRDGNGPFRTLLKPAIAPESLVKLAESNGLVVSYLSLYEGPAIRDLRRRLRLTGPVWSAAKFFVKALSFGKLDAENTDCIIVLGKGSSF